MRLQTVPLLMTIPLVAGAWLSGCGDDDDPMSGTDAGQADAGSPPEDGGNPGEDGGNPDGGTGEDAGDTDGGMMATARYEFESRFNAGESSINYRGQISRQILITDLKGEIKRIATAVSNDELDPTAVDIVALLNASFRDGSGELTEVPLPALTDEPDTLCQSTYDDLNDVNLFGKLAGNDDSTDHVDWDGDMDDDDPSTNTTPAFVGFATTEGLTVPVGVDPRTPTGLIDTFFATFAAQAAACFLDPADCPRSPEGTELPLYVTPNGLDLIQLVDKVLRTGINFSQAADDYLDDEPDDEGKGLLADNTTPRGEGEPDTALEHAWDEGLGYFGAARNYLDYSDEDITSIAYMNYDEMACIDAFSERNFNAAINAGKRDVGAMGMTDFTQTVFEAFVAGRRLITEADGALTPEQLDELRQIRDTAVSGFEQVIAATAIHYVNVTIADMQKCGTEDYSFVDHAKHWGELKGFAIGLQFNRASPWWTDDHDFGQLQADIGDAPVLCSDGDEDETYITTLEGVREAMRAAYGFDAAVAAAW